MKLFLDTEFTDFIQIELISIALVSEDGREFYAERNDYGRQDCSAVVRAEVEPLLGRVPGASCSRQELSRRLHAWFAALPQPATVLCDYFSDWELLADALQDDTHESPAHRPANLQAQQLLGPAILGDPQFSRAQAECHAQARAKGDLPRHHALADARALRAGYLAWCATRSGLQG